MTFFLKKIPMCSHGEKDRFCLMPTEIETVDSSTLFVCFFLLIFFLSFWFLFYFLCLFLITIFAKSLIDSVTNLIWM